MLELVYSDSCNWKSSALTHQYLCNARISHRPIILQSHMLLFHLIFSTCISLFVAAEGSNETRLATSPKFKDSSFLDIVLKFVEESRKAQDQLRNAEERSSSSKIVTPKVLHDDKMNIDQPQVSLLPQESFAEPSQSADNTTVKQTDFRIETGLFFDLDKNRGDDDDCDESEEEEEEEKSKLKKLLFFLPSSLNAKHTNSSNVNRIPSSALVNFPDSNHPNLFTSRPHDLTLAHIEQGSNDEKEAPQQKNETHTQTPVEEVLPVIPSYNKTRLRLSLHDTKTQYQENEVLQRLPVNLTIRRPQINATGLHPSGNKTYLLFPVNESRYKNPVKSSHSKIDFPWYMVGELESGGSVVRPRLAFRLLSDGSNWVTESGQVKLFLESFESLSHFVQQLMILFFNWGSDFLLWHFCGWNLVVDLGELIFSEALNDFVNLLLRLVL